MDKAWAVSACALVALLGCGTGKTLPEKSPQKKTFQGTPFAGSPYTLKFPDTWETNDKGFMGSDLISLSPLEGPDDAFRENVNVTLENLPDSMTHEEYLKVCLDLVDGTFGLPPGAKFEKARVGGRDGYHLRYTLQMGKIRSDCDVYLVIDKGASYCLTCSHEDGKRDAFKAVMDGIVASFSIP